MHLAPPVYVNVVIFFGISLPSRPQMTVSYARHHVTVSTLRSHALAVSCIPSVTRTHFLSGGMRYNWYSQ